MGEGTLACCEFPPDMLIHAAEEVESVHVQTNLGLPGERQCPNLQMNKYKVPSNVFFFFENKSLLLKIVILSPSKVRETDNMLSNVL